MVLNTTHTCVCVGFFMHRKQPGCSKFAHCFLIFILSFRLRFCGVLKATNQLASKGAFRGPNTKVGVEKKVVRSRAKL